MIKHGIPFHLGIVMVSITDDTIEATIPIDQSTMQRFGLLHGGASVVLAESLGSVAVNKRLSPMKNNNKTMAASSLALINNAPSAATLISVSIPIKSRTLSTVPLEQ